MMQAQSESAPVLTKTTAWPYILWLFPVLFFAYQFILRLWPGLMMHPIMQQLSIDASQFGLIAAFYYYGYAGMQIPAALLLERFGVARVMFGFALLCAIATAMFTLSNSLWLSCLSRFLVGAGSAIGFLGVSQVIAHWFPKAHFARMTGFSFSLGLMGAVYGGKPVTLLIDAWNWKQVGLMLAVAAFVIGSLIWIVFSMRRTHAPRDTAGASMTLSDFRPLLASRELWLLALANLLMVGALEGFSDVWGVPWLTVKYALNRADAAQLVSFVYIGMLFGGPLLAALSLRFGNLAVIALSGVGIALIFCALLLSATMPLWELAVLFFVMGLLCCYQVIVFAAGAEAVRAEYLGVCIAFLNCINMLGGSFFHTVTGRLLDRFWNGALSVDGIRLYSVEAYRQALMVIPLCALLGVLLVVCLAWRSRLSGRCALNGV
ncbi:MFS transporter [Legionella geestiana]|uniref:MFS transporter n=1 Tax=Legionella geestiana TaxID=45065 RepID=UPI001FEA50DC|nr:MFS transporter [Legionella geestiana]